MGFCASTAKIDIDAFAYIEVGVDVDENMFGFSAKKDLQYWKKRTKREKKACKPFSVFRKISCSYDTQLMVVKK